MVRSIKAVRTRKGLVVNDERVQVLEAAVAALGQYRELLTVGDYQSMKLKPVLHDLSELLKDERRGWSDEKPQPQVTVWLQRSAVDLLLRTPKQRRQHNVSVRLNGSPTGRCAVSGTRLALARLADTYRKVSRNAPSVRERRAGWLAAATVVKDLDKPVPTKKQLDRYYALDARRESLGDVLPKKLEDEFQELFALCATYPG